MSNSDDDDQYIVAPVGKYSLLIQIYLSFCFAVQSNFELFVCQRNSSFKKIMEQLMKVPYKSNDKIELDFTLSPGETLICLFQCR